MMIWVPWLLCRLSGCILLTTLDNVGCQWEEADPPFQCSVSGCQWWRSLRIGKKSPAHTTSLSMPASSALTSKLQRSSGAMTAADPTLPYLLLCLGCLLQAHTLQAPALPLPLPPHALENGVPPEAVRADKAPLSESIPGKHSLLVKKQKMAVAYWQTPHSCRHWQQMGDGASLVSGLLPSSKAIQK